jgi:Mn-containing catalase
MYLRIDKLPVELPASPEVDPIAAKSVQEIQGGRFGEIYDLSSQGD